MTNEAPDYFQPEHGMVLTHLLIVRDVERSREFYRTVLGATVVRERQPAILRLHNSYLVINDEGGPTDDKPTVLAQAPTDPNLLNSALNVRVTDVHAVYELWCSRGGQFLTEPKDHGVEIRCYLRDPDGYLIELGQATGILAERS
ncbi:Glyoxalase-like domain protein [Micromonospora sp. MW-13]|uniref:VOC family protein n=1 Tax=Micromonospora sp. MW-13 TaxID=2094022 RepID=UPI000ED97768|nr:VOC family protein [Micromonospora sp. MW-13]RGC66090.1 Glyoxalase-like domain protein [Micromonospora sp. MW-13]